MLNISFSKDKRVTDMMTKPANVGISSNTADVAIVFPDIKEKLEDEEILVIDPEYEVFVKDLAARQDSKTFSNQSRSHALTILRNVFNTAEKYVDIFSGKLNPSVYNDKKLLESVSAFIEKGGKVNILLQNDISPDRLKDENDFLNLMFKNRVGGCCSVGVVTKGNHLETANVHFLVSDDRTYRVELDIINHTAVCSFQAVPVATKLRDFFNNCVGSHTRDLLV